MRRDGALAADARAARRCGSTAGTIDPGRTVVYKGVLLSGVPNFALTFGYTNASWTLKADLAATYVCRLLRHMRAHGHGRRHPGRPAVGRARPADRPAVGLRGARRGPAAATRFDGAVAATNSYPRDLLVLRWGRITDGRHLRFSPAPAGSGRPPESHVHDVPARTWLPGRHEGSPDAPVRLRGRDGRGHRGRERDRRGAGRRARRARQPPRPARPRRATASPPSPPSIRATLPTGVRVAEHVADLADPERRRGGRRGARHGPSRHHAADQQRRGRAGRGGSTRWTPRSSTPSWR